MLYILPSLQVFLRRQVYLRGGLGVAHSWWSGSGGGRAETLLAAGLAIGMEKHAFGRWVAFEAAWRNASELCFDSCGFSGTRLLSLGVVVPFY